MSGSKAKEARKEAKELVTEINIKYFKDGSVDVKAPDNFLIFRRIMNAAEYEYIKEFAKEMSKMMNKRIIIGPNGSN